MIQAFATVLLKLNSFTFQQKFTFRNKCLEQVYDHYYLKSVTCSQLISSCILAPSAGNVPLERCDKTQYLGIDGSILLIWTLVQSLVHQVLESINKA